MYIYFVLLHLYNYIVSDPVRNISSCNNLCNFNYIYLFFGIIFDINLVRSNTLYINLVRSNTLYKYHTLIQVYILNIITYIRVQYKNLVRSNTLYKYRTLIQVYIITYIRVQYKYLVRSNTL